MPALDFPAEGCTDGVVVIQPYRCGDAAPLLAGVKDKLVTRFAHVRWADLSEDELEQRFTRDWPEAMAEGKAANLSIRDAESGDLCGHFVLFGIAWERQSAEIGFWLLPGARRRGTATRAIVLFCSWAFAALGLERIQAATDVENVASQGVLEKAGFTREGLLRSYHSVGDGARADFFLYSLLPGEATGL